MTGINPKPRRLAPEEIELLLKSKQEIQRHCEYLTGSKLLRNPQKA